MKLDTERFGENLKQMLKDRNMTQTDLANASGVSRIAISHWACNRCMPRLDCVAMIAKALNVTIDEMMEGVVE